MKFPEAIVEKAIRDEIAVAVQDRPTIQSSWRSAVDSLAVVQVVLCVEREPRITFPEDFIPPVGLGGLKICANIALGKNRIV